MDLTEENANSSTNTNNTTINNNIGLASSWAAGAGPGAALPGSPELPDGVFGSVVSRSIQ